MLHEINDDLPLRLGARVLPYDEWRTQLDNAIAASDKAYAEYMAKVGPVKWIDPQLAGMPSDMKHPSAPRSVVIACKEAGTIKFRRPSLEPIKRGYESVYGAKPIVIDASKLKPGDMVCGGGDVALVTESNYGKGSREQIAKRVLIGWDPAKGEDKAVVTIAEGAGLMGARIVGQAEYEARFEANYEQWRKDGMPAPARREWAVGDMVEPKTGGWWGRVAQVFESHVIVKRQDGVRAEVYIAREHLTSYIPF